MAVECIYEEYKHEAMREWKQSVMCEHMKVITALTADQKQI